VVVKLPNLVMGVTLIWLTCGCGVLVVDAERSGFGCIIGCIEYY
jgi:hypothetical protein